MGSKSMQFRGVTITASDGGLGVRGGRGVPLDWVDAFAAAATAVVVAAAGWLVLRLLEVVVAWAWLLPLAGGALVVGVVVGSGVNAARNRCALRRFRAHEREVAAARVQRMTAGPVALDGGARGELGPARVQVEPAEVLRGQVDEAPGRAR